MTQEFSLLALFILGLFSTLHCVGMCGGVVGALTFSLTPEIRENRAKLVWYIGAYNLGRIMSYGIGGLIVGAIGMSLIGLIGMHNAHLIARVLTASMMILVGLYVAGWFPQMAKLDQLGSGLWKRLQPLSQRFLPVRSLPQAFGFGAVWGWLPCGLVYTALLLAALGGSAVQGGLGMLAFGLGTLPALMATGLITGGLSGILQRPRVKHVFGLIVIGLGLLILLMPMKHDHHMPAGSAVESSHDDSDHMNQSEMKCGASMHH